MTPRSNEDLSVVENFGNGEWLNQISGPAGPRSLTVDMIESEEGPTLTKVVLQCKVLRRNSEVPSLHFSEEWSGAPIRRAIEACCKKQHCDLLITARKGPSTRRRIQTRARTPHLSRLKNP